MKDCLNTVFLKGVSTLQTKLSSDWQTASESPSSTHFPDIRIGGTAIFCNFPKQTIWRWLPLFMWVQHHEYCREEKYPPLSPFVRLIAWSLRRRAKETRIHTSLDVRWHVSLKHAKPLSIILTSPAKTVFHMFDTLHYLLQTLRSSVFRCSEALVFLMMWCY